MSKLNEILNNAPEEVKAITVSGSNVTIYMDDINLSIIHKVGTKVFNAFNLDEDNASVNVSVTEPNLDSLSEGSSYAKR